MTEAVKVFQVGTMTIDQQVTIRASKTRVFHAIVHETGAWWDKPYRISSDDAKALVFEPRVGGRLYEDWGDGTGGLWGLVTAIKPDELVEVTGAIGSNGMVHGIVRFELKEQAGSTVLRLTHRAFGEMGTDPEEYNNGWAFLLGELKKLLER